MSRQKTEQGQTEREVVGGATVSDSSEPIVDETQPASSAMDLFVGRVLSHYRLEERLGGGGMGMLYRATDLKLGRAVAIKLLARHLVSDETAKARFVREARAASALDHPNIANIYEIGEADGELFIAMALYEGETLRQRLEKGRLAVDEALKILRQVLLGLEAAHGAGIVHRDIKPANILVTSKGTAKILDFGLAKLISDLQAQTMTAMGQAMGTVLYMAPEQLRGDAVDARSDLWSFGVLTYELLAGTPPFKTDSNAATVSRILNDEAASLAAVPGVPDWVAQLVSELLRKNPAERPQTATEVLRRLEGGEPARSFPVQRSPAAEGPGSLVGPLTSPAAGVAPKPVGLSSWFAELKRRRVFRALVGYGIAAFAVLQIIEPIMHGAHWPDMVLSYVVAGLAAGFPIVITLAWVFDVRGGRIERTPPAPGPRGIQLGLMLVGIGVLAAAPGLVYYFIVRGGGRSFSTEVRNSASNAASVAVLPFASLSSGEENAYFAQGFHDELLRQLGRIGDLRVISRTSVLQYKDGARNLREIAEALDVSSIVEGSVQRAGNRVRVEAKLIDARSDRQMWADRYDRDLTDVFGIQTAVAEEIARTLQARLSPAQKTQIERKPTQSTEAYDLYLRGLEYANRPGRLPSNFAVAERFYRQAIETDPSFALAWARLAFVKIWTYWSVAGTPDRVAQGAREAAEQSLRIQPDLPEGHLALGLYHYWRDREYENALKELEIARAGIPAEATHYVGMVLRRHGKFDEAIRNQEEAVRLDPRSLLIWLELANSFLSTRRYKEADQVLDRVLALAPDFPGASIIRAYIYEAWKGDTSLAKGALKENRGRLDPGGRLGVAQAWIVTLLEHDPREALSFLDSLQSDSLNLGDKSIPKAFLYAVAHEAIGDTARATKEYETALPLLQAEVDEKAGHAPQRSLVARAYAGLGRKESALREAKRAVELLPVSKDALYGADIEIERAAVEARVGETDAAIEHIRYLLSIPCNLSPALLRIDPRWALLRDDPRFRRLAELENK